MTKRILLALTLFSFCEKEARSDHIVLSNGDRITGTIIRLAAGRIEVDSVLIGTISTDWTVIENIQSDTNLYVTLRNDRLIVGAITGTGRTLEIRTSSTTVPVDKGDVVSIRSAIEYQQLLLERERSNSPRFVDFWSAAIDAAISSTQGNADTRALNVGIRAARTTENNQLSGYFTTVFASNSTSGKSITTANAIRGGSRYELRMNERLFTFGFTELEFDRFQDLDLRLVVGGGVGIDLIESQRSSLEFFGGASSNQEFFANGLERKSGEIVFGEDLTHQFNRLTTVTQRLAVFPNLSNLGEFRVTFDTAAVTRLNSWFSWQVTISDRYLSNPLAGKKHNDLLFTTGIRITPGGSDLGNIGPGSTPIN